MHQPGDDSFATLDAGSGLGMREEFSGEEDKAPLVPH
jgi:hypothetical protein